MIFHDLLFKPGPGFGIGWDLWPGATSLAGYIGIPVKSIQILVWWAHLHVQLVLGDASQLVGHQSPTYYLGIFRYNLNKEEMGIISITKMYLGLGICWVLYLSYNMFFILSKWDTAAIAVWLAPQDEMVRSYVRSAVATNSTYQNTKWVPWRKAWDTKKRCHQTWLENPPVIDDFPSCQLPF